MYGGFKPTNQTWDPTQYLLQPQKRKNQQRRRIHKDERIPKPKESTAGRIHKAKNPTKAKNPQTEESKWHIASPVRRKPCAKTLTKGA
jgi:hypothetical protein